MSYSDTEEKLYRLLDSIDERSSLFKVDVEAFKKNYEELQEEIAAKWETLNTDVYKFVFDPAEKTVDIQLDGSGILYDTYPLHCTAYHTCSSVLKKNYPVFKQIVANRMLQAMHFSKPPKDLRAFKNKIIGSAKIVESRITQSFFNDLYNIYISIEDGYKELEQEWNKLETVELKDLIDRANTLIEQAADEWVKQGGIKVNVIVYVKSTSKYYDNYGHNVRQLTPEGIADAFKDIIPYEDIDPVKTWLGAEKQVKDRVDEALHPLEALSEYHSDTSH